MTSQQIFSVWTILKVNNLSIVIVMTVISIFSANLKDSLMIYISGRFELPSYKSKVEIRTGCFSPRITVNDDVIFGSNGEF